MADAISIQELIDARTDAKTLEEAVNGDAVTTVLSRLGETYPTLSNALNQIDSKLDSADAQIKQAITDLFQNGGLPATPFATKALMTASALVDGDYAMVTEDTVNNGLYVKTAGAWVKSAYDPLTTEEIEAQIIPNIQYKVKSNIEDIDVFERTSLNLFNRNIITPDSVISWFDGVMKSNIYYVVSDFIEVKPNTSYTGSGGTGSPVFYDANKVYQSSTPSVQLGTMTTGVDTKYVRLNVAKSTYNTFTLVEGDVAGVPEVYGRYRLKEGNTLEIPEGALTSKWKGKKMGIIGDSIAESATAYWRLFNTTKGFSAAISYAVGGTAIAVRPEPYNLSAMCLRYSEMAPDLDLVLVAGGTNDFGSVPLGSFEDKINTTVYGSMRLLLEGLIAKYPVGSIGVILPPSRNGQHNVTASGKTFQQMTNAYIECCRYYSIPYFDMMNNSSPLRLYDPANQAVYAPDGLHPNAAAHKILAKNIGAWLETI